MKIIDYTAYFDTETGEISFQDRIRAMMKFGSPWLKEVEAQNQVIPVLGKVLDRSYTLLRNVTPPGLDTSFPLILVGPTGVFVINVSPVTGMFRAKGDQWGTISGDAFKIEKPNLLTRTENMARAIQVFLQRQGMIMTGVEAILLCSDLSVNVDSIRPIIRVVMRDALERFAVSITQARVVLNAEAVQDVISRILNPPIPNPSGPEPEQVPVVPEAPAPIVSPEPESASIPSFAFPEEPAPEPEPEPVTLQAEETPDLSQAPMWINDLAPLPEDEVQDVPAASKGPGLNKNQWTLLIAMFVIWAVLVGIFLFVVIRDQWSLIQGLLP